MDVIKNIIQKIKDNPKIGIGIGIAIAIVIVGAVIMSFKSSKKTTGTGIGTTCVNLTGDWDGGWYSGGVWNPISIRTAKKSGTKQTYNVWQSNWSTPPLYTITIKDDCKNIDRTENGVTNPWGILVDNNTINNTGDATTYGWQWKRKV